MRKLTEVPTKEIAKIFWSKGKCFIVLKKDGKQEQVIDDINRKSY